MEKEKNVYCNCLYYSVNALSRKITKMADEEFAVTGLSSSYAFIMMTINSHKKIQPNKIAEIMMLMPSTVTRLIEKLEIKGLVKRETVGKYTFITPTKMGRDLDKSIRTAWSKLYQRYTQQIGKDLSDELTGKVFNAVEKLEQ